MKALVCGMIGFEQLPKPRKGPEMKDSKESMDIIEAYDLFGSYNGAAKYVGCSPNTVKKFVQARSAGQLIRQGKYERRPKATDKYVAVIEEAVDRSKARVRANQIHLRLVALGYSGSMRSTRWLVFFSAFQAQFYGLRETGLHTWNRVLKRSRQIPSS